MKIIVVPAGQQFDRLTVIKEAEKHGVIRSFVCKCQCGNVKTVLLRHLRSGHSKSCGCLNKEVVSKMMTTHGKTKTAEYSVWYHLRTRCSYKKGNCYHNYGGRGITVCERWSLFENFLADMGERPSAKHTIDRIDNDGPYSPENCHWATQVIQQNNKSNNRILELNGVRMTVAQWARKLQVKAASLYTRLDRRWSVKDTLTKPMRVRLSV